MRFRLPILSFALIAVVAACSKPAPVAKDANEVTALPVAPQQNLDNPAGGPPENHATTPAAPSSSTVPMPSALQGRWGLTPDDCTSALGDAKGLLVINSGELRFYESRAVPSSGVQADARSITGNFHFTGEGQNWTRFEKVERQGDKLVRTETNPAASYTYAKC